MTREIDRDDPEWIEIIAKIEKYASNAENPRIVVESIQDEFHVSNSSSFRTLTLDTDGYLPAAVVCEVEDLTLTFGSHTIVRRTLYRQLLDIVRLSREIGAHRLLVDGSFITSKPDPHDVDIALWAPEFVRRFQYNEPAARELWTIMQQIHVDNPVQLYIESSESAWWSWWRLFSQVKDPFVSRVYKGLIEVRL